MGKLLFRKLIMDYAKDIKQFKLYPIMKAITIREQDKIYQNFIKEISFNSKTTILDVGATPNLDEIHNNIVGLYPYTKNITVLSDQDCSILKKKYPDIKTIKNEGNTIQLPNNAFDVIHCKATIEHVGGIKNQITFLRELLRISKEYVFLTTPNRYYPIDFHTFHPFIHWFPKKFHRKILSFLGEKFYNHEKNLNLLSKKDLLKICKKNNIRNFKLIYHYFLGLPSNLILIIKKS